MSTRRNIYPSFDDCQPDSIQVKNTDSDNERELDTPPMASNINELNQRVELIESNVASGFERLARMLESVLTRNERPEIGYRRSQHECDIITLTA
ncbi:uncharacterized protein ASCRUDRAFT_74595, partial [Ascoidea rubescens DSM 1968]